MRLYDEHAHAVMSFLVFRTGDPALAEDLLADTFERVLRTQHGFDRHRGGERTWLLSIALNLLRDNHRRRQVESRAYERVMASITTGDAGSEIAAVVERDGIERALASLTDEERESVALRYGGDLTIREIASLVGQKPTTIDGRIHRSLRKLRGELEAAR